MLGLNFLNFIVPVIFFQRLKVVKLSYVGRPFRIKIASSEIFIQ